MADADSESVLAQQLHDVVASLTRSGLSPSLAGQLERSVQHYGNRLTPSSAGASARCVRVRPAVGRLPSVAGNRLFC